MANSPQAKKRARQNLRRCEVNKARRSRIRTFLRKIEEAITAGDQTVAKEALRQAQPELMRGVTKGIFHKNTAARKISRLSARVKSTAAAQQAAGLVTLPMIMIAYSQSTGALFGANTAGLFLGLFAWLLAIVGLRRGMRAVSRSRLLGVNDGV